MSLSALNIRHDRVRSVSALVIAVLLALTAASIIIPLSANSYFTSIAEQWRRQNEISERQGDYISDIYQQLGYGGFIHHFKNYVLRQEPALRSRLGHDVANLESAMRGLESVLENDDSSEADVNREAMKVIRKTVDSYVHNLEIADTAVRLHWLPERTDSLVRVDDVDAILALSTLRESWQRQKEFARVEFENLVMEATGRLQLFLLFVPLLAFSGVVIIWFVRRLTREITQRRMAQDELRRAELIVASISLLGNGISIFDRDLKLAAFNRDFFELLGFPEKMCVPGRSLADFFRHNADRGEYGPGDPEKLVRERMDLARKFQPHRFERTRADGTVIEVCGNPLPDAGGIVSIYTDITARKYAETALAEKERQLRTALDGMSDGIFVADKDLNYLLFNERYLEYIDLPRHLIGVGKPIIPAIRMAAERGDYGPGDVEELVRRRVDALQDSTHDTADITISNGKRFLELRKAPMAGGGAVVIATDITERNRARAEIELKETQLSMALESMSAGIVLFDKDRRLQLFNDAASELYQFPQNFLRKGMALDGIIRIRAERGDFGDGPPEELARARIESYAKTPHGRMVDRMPNGRFLDVFRAPTPDGDTVIVFHDITERMNTEERLRQNEEQLTQNIIDLVETQKDLEVQSQNLTEMAEMYAEEKEKAQASERSKSEFLASMSHEIRTPMTGILGFADILIDAELPKAQHDMVLKLKSAGQSLLTIINDILDLSKLEAGKLEIEKVDFNLASVIEDAIELVRLKADQQGFDIAIHLTNNLPHSLKGDPTRLRQVLINLVGNAVKFTHEGGIVVRASHTPTDDKRYLLRIEVEDTGIGISDSARERLFQEFTQADASTSRRYEGTGLGLAISKRLTGLMGGDIGVESKLGKGSTFWFTLVAEPATTNIERRHGANRRRVSTVTRALKILIAEDNELNRQILNAVLAPLGHSISFAISGAEAVEAVKTPDTAFDLILMDIRMPEMNGPDAARTIRQMGGAFATLPIIAVTADVMEENISSYLEAGMDAYATKPINREALLVTINEVLGEEIHVMGNEIDETSGETGTTPFEDEAEGPINEAVAVFLDSLNSASSQ